MPIVVMLSSQTSLGGYVVVVLDQLPFAYYSCLYLHIGILYRSVHVVLYQEPWRGYERQGASSDILLPREFPPDPCASLGRGREGVDSKAFVCPGVTPQGKATQEDGRTCLEEQGTHCCGTKRLQLHPDA